MNTQTVCIHKNHPLASYMRVNTSGTRAVRNTANFLIRNIYTALGKAEQERTPNEQAVLLRVSMNR